MNYEVVTEKDFSIGASGFPNLQDAKIAFRKQIILSFEEKEKMTCKLWGRTLSGQKLICKYEKNETDERGDAQ